MFLKVGPFASVSLILFTGNIFAQDNLPTELPPVASPVVEDQAADAGTAPAEVRFTTQREMNDHQLEILRDRGVDVSDAFWDLGIYPSLYGLEADPDLDGFLSARTSRRTLQLSDVVVSRRDLLPVPHNIDNFTSHNLLGADYSPIGVSGRLLGTGSAFSGRGFLNGDAPQEDQGLIFGLTVNQDFAAIYDSGFVPVNGDNKSLFDIQNLSLGSPLEGQYQTFEKQSFSQWDLQHKNLGGLLHAQAEISVDLTEAHDNPVRSLFGRAMSLDGGALSIPGGTLDVLIGLEGTMFGDKDSVPRSIVSDVVPIGVPGYIMDGDGLARPAKQVRVNLAMNSGWEFGLAVEDEEDPTREVTAPANATVLKRYPNLVSRIRYTRDHNSFQVAALVRGLGFDGPDPAIAEQFVTGWGVSGQARWQSEDRWTSYFLGVTGGNGLGSYLFGSGSAAATDLSGQLRAISSVGAYAGIQRLWQTRQVDDKVAPGLWSNAGYSYLQTETLTGMAGDTNRRLQQAWINTVWQINGNVALGLEYIYGERQVRDGREADNHRVQFVFRLTTAPGQTEETTTSRRRVGAHALRQDTYETESGPRNRASHRAL